MDYTQVSLHPKSPFKHTQFLSLVFSDPTLCKMLKRHDLLCSKKILCFFTALSFCLSVQGCLGFIFSFHFSKISRKMVGRAKPNVHCTEKTEEKNNQKTTQDQTLLQITKFGSNNLLL